MDTFLHAFFGTIPDSEALARITSRLVAAMILGAAIGFERELEAKPAGLRTHVLVTLAAAIFVMAPAEAGMAIADLSRVIQGVATGIGFIGAGAILKLHEREEIQGLTTAATLWMATAIGIAVGLGHIVFAAIVVALAWVVLRIFIYVDAWVRR